MSERTRVFRDPPPPADADADAADAPADASGKESKTDTFLVSFWNLFISDLRETFLHHLNAATTQRKEVHEQEMDAYYQDSFVSLSVDRAMEFIISTNPPFFALVFFFSSIRVYNNFLCIPPMQGRRSFVVFLPWPA